MLDNHTQLWLHRVPFDQLCTPVTALHHCNSIQDGVALMEMCFQHHLCLRFILMSMASPSQCSGLQWHTQPPTWLTSVRQARRVWNASCSQQVWQHVALLSSSELVGCGRAQGQAANGTLRRCVVLRNVAANQPPRCRAGHRTLVCRHNRHSLCGMCYLQGYSTARKGCSQPCHCNSQPCSKHRCHSKWHTLSMGSPTPQWWRP